MHLVLACICFTHVQLVQELLCVYYYSNSHAHVHIDAQHYASLLSLMAASSRITRMNQLLLEMRERGIPLDRNVYTLLINAFAGTKMVCICQCIYASIFTLYIIFMLISTYAADQCLCLQ